MNIMEKLLPWTVADDGDQVDEAPKRQERNHGPRPVRMMTNGQIRRAIKRQQDSHNRKVQLGHRRRWMDNRLSIAVLRGQLQAVGEIPFADGTYADGKAAAARPGVTIEDVLCERFGSVEDAKATYEAILAEAAA